MSIYYVISIFENYIDDEIEIIQNVSILFIEYVITRR